jgi:hypothetical protein
LPSKALPAISASEVERLGERRHADAVEPVAGQKFGTYEFANGVA